MFRERCGRVKSAKRRALILLFWLLIWHILAVFAGNSLLLVTPLEALLTLVRLSVTPQFWEAAGGSMLRIAGGFFLGFFTGLLLAAAAAGHTLLEELLSPVMNLFKTVPVASLTVLLLIWWSSEMLAVSICFLVVTPEIYLHTLEGVRSTDRKLPEMAKVFGMPFWNRFFYIYRPSLKPFLYGSMKLSLGMSWKSGVAAEIIGTPQGSIGERLYMAKIYLDTAELFAWTAAVILLSLLFEKAVMKLAACFFAWEPSCRSALTGAKKKRISRRAAVRNEETGEFPNGTSADGISCTNLTKSYGGKTVISDFTASYPAGRIHYLRSPSGSGKTTFLRLLCGLEEPDAGRIERRGCISMMFQEDRLCEDYSALLNVEMAVGSNSGAKEALLMLLEESAIERPCRELSGGMKRRAALVRAMEAESDIVLLDEPFTGMDDVTRERVRQYIEDRRGNRTVIVATHI